MLHGDVEVGDYLPSSGDALEQLVRDARRVEVEQTYPYIVGQRAFERVEQLDKPLAGAVVRAVDGEVLPDNAELARAFADELLRFLHYHVDRQAAQRAAYRRYRAVGAAVAAAFADFQVARVFRRRGQRAAAARSVERRREAFEHALPVLGLRPEVYRRYLRGEPLAIAVDEAADHADFLKRAALPQLFEVEYRLYALFDGGADEAAGVDDGGLRLFDLGNELVARGLERARKALAVYSVFGAAEGQQVYLHNLYSSVMLSETGWFSM